MKLSTPRELAEKIRERCPDCNGEGARVSCDNPICFEGRLLGDPEAAIKVRDEEIAKMVEGMHLPRNAPHLEPSLNCPACDMKKKILAALRGGIIEL